MVVKNRIFKIITKRGISQPKLADALGVTPNTVNNWCCNRSQPKLSNIAAIGEYLGIDPHKLIIFVETEGKKLKKKKKLKDNKEAIDQAFLASFKKTKKRKTNS